MLQPLALRAFSQLSWGGAKADAFREEVMRNTRLVQRVCELYRLDYRCLRLPLPDVCNGSERHAGTVAGGSPARACLGCRGKE